MPKALIERLPRFGIMHSRGALARICYRGGDSLSVRVDLGD